MSGEYHRMVIIAEFLKLCHYFMKSKKNALAIRIQEMVIISEGK